MDTELDNILLSFSDSEEKEKFILANDKATKVGEISDGYHTFDELYEHRCVLFLHLLKALHRISNDGWWSRKHHDGTEFPGWVIAGAFLGEEDKAITYHLPEKWIPTLMKYAINIEPAPEWDGHTSADVLNRLIEEL